jgi:hypothetical protein
MCAYIGYEKLEKKLIPAAYSLKEAPILNGLAIYSY